MRSLCLAVLLFLAVPAPAEVKEVAIVPPTGPIIIVCIDGDNCTFRYIPRAKPTGPTPTPTPGPQPDELSERGKEIYDLAKKISNDHMEECAQSLAQINREIVKLNLSDPKTKALALKVAYDEYFKKVGHGDDWKAVRAKMSEQWNKMVQ